MAYRRGADFRLEIGGVFFACTRIVNETSGQAIDMTNTEGIPGRPAELGAVPAIGTSAVIADVPKGTLTISCYWNEDENPWALPFFKIGSYTPVVAYPSGIAFESVQWDWGFMCILSLSHTGQIPGGQPIEIRLASDGPYAGPLEQS